MSDKERSKGDPYVEIFRLGSHRTYKGTLTRRLPDNTLITVFHKRERHLNYADTYRVSIKVPGQSVFFVPTLYHTETDAIRGAIDYCNSQDINWVNVDLSELLDQPEP